jgi:hypothetical protein
MLKSSGGCLTHRILCNTLPSHWTRHDMSISGSVKKIVLKLLSYMKKLVADPFNGSNSCHWCEAAYVGVAIEYLPFVIQKSFCTARSSQSSDIKLNPHVNPGPLSHAIHASLQHLCRTTALNKHPELRPPTAYFTVRRFFRTRKI